MITVLDYITGSGGEPIIRNWSEVYPGYFLNDGGELYSEKSHKILKPKPLDREGHLGYCLYVNGKRIYCYLHRLLASEFIEKEHNSQNVVRHLNDDPQDNDLSNLCWGTQYDNIHDAINNNTAYMLTDEDREKSHSLSRKPTRAINLKTGDVRTYRSLNDAVRDLGVQQANACKTITGERAHTCGWRFEYIE